MKHYLPMAVLALAFTACSDDYDDTALWEQVNDNTNRIEALETWQEQVNSNIAALQQLLNTTDYITSVTPVTKDGKEVGYTISFRNSDPITIYHGEKGDKGDKGDQGEQGEQGIPGEPGKDGADGSDGSDGSTPQVGLQQGDDGNWYWTLNGSLMKDPNGDPIPANGEDGKDGDDGDDGNNAPTPQILLGNNLSSGGKVMTDSGTTQADAWYLSVDNGATWYRISGDKGDQGNDGTNGDDGVLKVETAEDGNSVTITFDDNSSIVLPTWQWAESIEEDIAELNGQLEAYAGLMQGKLLITGVKATKDGQTITYITVDEDGKPSDPQSFTITNGKDGEKGDDGATPTVEIGDNGNWIINGTDTNVPATGESGKDGKTPTFKIENGYLYYQFNGDSDWKELGKVEGPQGDKGEQGVQGKPGNDGVFTGITYTPGDATAVLKLADGTTIEVAIYQPLTIGEGTGTLTVVSGKENPIQLYFEGNYEAIVAQIIQADDDIAIDTRADNGWKVTADLDAKTVTVTAPANGKALLDVSLIRADGSKVTASRVLWAVNVITTENCTNINGTGDYVLKGSFGSSITITGGSPDIYLDNVNMDFSRNDQIITPISITNGANPIIHVVGSNNITAYSYNNLRMAGIYTAGADGAAIGGYCSSGTDHPCGNITINNVTVYAYAIRANVVKYPPAIGSTGDACGKITITDAIVHAQGAGEAPAIGAESSVPEITIKKSEIHAYRGSNADYIGI